MAAPTPPLSQIFPPGSAVSAPVSLPAGASGYPLQASQQGPRVSFAQSTNEEPLRRPPVRVPPPRPRTPGGPEFYGCVPKHSATFAWSELCATPAPEASLAPVPQIPQKTWYNSFVYLPEQASHEDRQFLQRFVKGKNGEWIDVVKARRLVDSLEAQRQKQMKEAMEREMILSGTATQSTHYIDPYTGEKLLNFRGKLEPEQMLYEEYHIHRGNVLTGQDEAFDFDNLRIRWPFAQPDRNKPVSQHTYDWFDRRNMYIPTDRSCELVEMRSMYIEKEELFRWWHDDQPSESRQSMPQPSVQQVTF